MQLQPFATTFHPDFISCINHVSAKFYLCTVCVHWIVLSVPRGIKSPDPPGPQPLDGADPSRASRVNAPTKKRRKTDTHDLAAPSSRNSRTWRCRVAPLFPVPAPPVSPTESATGELVVGVAGKPRQGRRRRALPENLSRASPENLAKGAAGEPHRRRCQRTCRGRRRKTPPRAPPESPTDGAAGELVAGVAGKPRRGRHRRTIAASSSSEKSDTTSPVK
jgi:hypothetical protein